MNALPTTPGLAPATHYQRVPFRLVNRCLEALAQVGVCRSPLSADGLMAKAVADTGLSDFGDESFLPALRCLVRALHEEARLNPLGMELTRISLLRLLRNRLQAEDLFRRYPEILDRQITAPVVIVGLARSGTTRLHRLLAADSGFSHLTAWESVNPVPGPESFAARAAGKPEPRIAGIESALKVILYLSPGIAAVHPLGATEVEEEIGLLQHAFASQLFEIMAVVPSFASWLVEHDQRPAYQYMVKLLKLVSWWRQDPPGATWLLKSPQHMQDLDALLTVFPDARLIFPHRDPVKVVGSVCSTAWNSLVRDTDRVDPHWVGADWLEKIERMLRKTQSIRANVPAAQQLDVLYERISRDHVGEMRQIYDFLGIPLSGSAVAAMQAWLARNAQYKHGAHRYDLADFGLDPAVVDRRLEWYRERYGIPRERINPNR